MTVTTEIKPVTELNQKDFWKFKNNHRIKDMQLYIFQASQNISFHAVKQEIKSQKKIAGR